CLVLENPFFTRTLLADRANHAFYTSVFIDRATGINHCITGSKEFSFSVNGKEVSGGRSAGLVDYQRHAITSGVDGRQTLAVVLSGRPGTLAANLEITLYYEIYPDLAVIRKWLSVTNNKPGEIVLTNLEWENVSYEIASPSWIPHICTFPDVYAQYGQCVFKPPYVGRTEDAALLVYDYEKREGLIVGNEGPSILKRTSIYPESTFISIGLGFASDDFPFKKQLSPGETFVSPKGFLMPYKGDVWQDAFGNGLAQYTRKYMGVKLFEKKLAPTFFYNTWNPFKAKISSSLIKQVADVTSKAGVEYLIIDDGWQNNYGDWDADTEKFPGGLKPVCDYIRSKGMKPGLWISAAHVENKSRVRAEHPEWLVRNRENEPANLHAEVPADCQTMCLATPWYDYIKAKITLLIESNHIGYLKLDLASAHSAYKLNNYEVGCYASGHGHHDHAESLYVLITKTYQLIDELKARFPDLYVDCTFELFGKIYGTDYFLVQHADGDWLSNIEEKPPYGPLYLRQLSYERARVIPPSTLLIGNMQMNWDDSELCFQSLLGAAPLMLGDPRGLSEPKIAWFRQWSDWFRKMESKYLVLT
ncbi:MAG: alpha-galactosidase, partial [Opitutaceae bacterium]